MAGEGFRTIFQGACYGQKVHFGDGGEVTEPLYPPLSLLHLSLDSASGLIIAVQKKPKTS